MKANKAARLAPDDSGVSAVLGAVLMFGLLVAALAMIQAEFVPVWQEEKESDLATLVSNQLAQVNADMGRQVGNASAAGVSDPLTLATSGFTFFSGSTQPGSVTFTPVSNGITVSSNQLTIQEQGGVELYGLGETWRGVVTGTSIANITHVYHLRMRLFDVANAADLASATFSIGDSTGAYAGKLTIVNHDHGADLQLEIQTFSATSATTPISSESVSFKKQNAPPIFYYDALNPNYLFLDVVGAASKPMRLDTINGGITSDFTITYDEQVGDDVVRVGGQGSVVPNYTKTSPGGLLQVTRPNQELPEQTYTLEYGAVLLDQPDGSAMVVPPAFDIAATPAQLGITWSVPGLSGQANAIAGSSQASVELNPTGLGNSVQALGPRVTFTIVTSHPLLWTAFWDGQLADAGLTGNVAASGGPCSSSDFHYTICSTATTATLNLYGPIKPQASLVNDIFLKFRESDVNVQLRASG